MSDYKLDLAFVNFPLQTAKKFEEPQEQFIFDNTRLKFHRQTFQVDPWNERFRKRKRLASQT
jgi:hypothetical protein